MDTFCKIYIVDSIDLNRLIESFINKFKGLRESKLISFVGFDVYFGVNHYYDPLIVDDITLSKYYMDVNFQEEISIEDCVNQINLFLLWFRSSSIKVVASCDYEDMLLN